MYIVTMSTITKQKLLAEPLSSDAVRLARALVNTYLDDEEEFRLEIKLSVIFKLLGLESSQESLRYLVSLFEELNEPLAVRDFNFYAKSYPLRLITFCKYSFEAQNVIVELSEEYLFAQKTYMQDAFLSFAKKKGK